ncbi:hypothetical protein KSD_74140 [Ktedonobacter sp. SOSP1-85]|uniref:type II toxin-antitoxin system RelE/ParE family toxin n=1 Tax=Ktedonobacter sp. SOSP1-85 TaxID=2778367 RepID=UPI0019169769|nr:type II toxin-antitoxin system RelE/ParE family toxin [Ktedonobacter sp. SOSP1-85]GHO79643.1 hypothetical protein KSD_74140 [Ktedonobacter sp. SOSP1-85]
MDESQTWDIAYYKNANGSSPALEFIKGLQERDQYAVLYTLKRLANRNTRRSMVSRIEGDDHLWELRVFAGNSCRLIFFYEDRHIVVLHGFLKKTKKIPGRFIQLAQKRYKEYLLSA